MKKLIVLIALAATFTAVGCSSLLQGLVPQPVASPSASATPVLPAAPVLAMICASPAAKADAQIAAACAVYAALGGK